MTPPPRRPDDDPPPLPPLPPLPVAEPVRPEAGGDEPAVAEVVGPENPDDLPVAVPVRPAGSSARSFPRPPAPPDPGPEGPTRPRVFAACAVLGCLGVGLVAAVGFLAYGVILILDHLGERAADPDRPAAVGGDGSRPGPIRPTALATRTAVVPVGGEFDAVVRAAGGRFLLFRIPGAPARVVAFDANAGAMVPGFELRLTEPNSLLAGGASKLWVYKPKAHEVVRVDLPTGRVEQRAPAPKDAEGRVGAIAAGAGSDGPVYLVAGTRAQTDLRLLDGAGLNPTGSVRFPDGLDAVRARASDDGAVLAVSGPRGAAVVRPDPAGGYTFTRLKADDTPPTLATPAPDGRYVYTPAGVFRPDGRPAFEPADDTYPLPAAHGGDVYLTLGVSPGGSLTGPATVHPAGSRATAATLTDVIVPRGLGAANTGDVPPDQRVYYWPGAGLAAVLPADNKAIRLWKVDLPSPKGGRGE
jgi:hypothetical protein